jgi:Protein of unknown function (DUF3631)/Domain of unknown function (DUF3854)
MTRGRKPVPAPEPAHPGARPGVDAVIPERPAAGGDPGLFGHHADYLRERAVNPGVAKERGYSSTALPGWLRGEGFSHAAAQLVPGLVIPVRDFTGAVRLHQYRPDRPRESGGKLVKVETPHKARLVVDVPLRVVNKVRAPGAPLWVTESPVKADAAVSAGLVAVGILGVWGWRGRNSRDGKTTLADWDEFALDGRAVYLVPDSDVATNAKVADAVTRLGGVLGARGADVRYVILPPAGDGSKVGLDDWLARNGADPAGLLVLADDEPPTPPRATPRAAAAPRPLGPPTSEPAALLAELHDWLCCYVAFPSPHAAVAVTLWIVHTHLVACFDATGRLVLLSPEPECGKTRALELAELTCAGAEMLSDASGAYLFRRIGSADAGPVTLLLDEADAIWKRKGDDNAEAIRSIINAGHRKGASVGRADNHGAALTRYPVYAPAAIAAKGDPLPDTIMSRALVIHMRRRAPGQVLSHYRQRITRPEGEALRDQLAAWAASVAARVGDPWPAMPDGVNDRPADVWEPLLTVADLAGGDWPERAREACTAFVTGAQDDTQTTTGTRLLTALRDLFYADKSTLDGPATDMFSADILRALNGQEEAPWGRWNDGKGINPSDLARSLRPYGVRSKSLRVGERTGKGYARADLEDTWSRYVAKHGF